MEHYLAYTVYDVGETVLTATKAITLHHFHGIFFRLYSDFFAFTSAESTSLTNVYLFGGI
jgi:hypothetical protein